MYCTNCGKSLKLNTRFCGSCGCNIEEVKLLELPISVKNQRYEKSGVKASECLLASVCFTVLFSLLLLAAMKCALHVYWSFVMVQYFNVEPNMLSLFLEQTIPETGQLFVMLLPGLIASWIIAWGFMPHILTDCKNDAPVGIIFSRLITLAVFIITFCLFLEMPKMVVETALGESLLASLRLVRDSNLISAYFVRVGILCIAFVPLLLKVIKTSVANKSTKALTVLAFVLCIGLIFVNVVIGVVIFGSVYSPPILEVLYLLVRFGANIVAGGLSMLFFVICVIIARSFKKAS